MFARLSQLKLVFLEANVIRSVDEVHVNADNWWRREHVLVTPAWITHSTSSDGPAGRHEASVERGARARS